MCVTANRVGVKNTHTKAPKVPKRRCRNSYRHTSCSATAECKGGTLRDQRPASTYLGKPLIMLTHRPRCTLKSNMSVCAHDGAYGVTSMITRFFGRLRHEGRSLVPNDSNVLYEPELCHVCEASNVSSCSTSCSNSLRATTSTCRTDLFCRSVPSSPRREVA